MRGRHSIYIINFNFSLTLIKRTPNISKLSPQIRHLCVFQLRRLRITRLPCIRWRQSVRLFLILSERHCLVFSMISAHKTRGKSNWLTVTRTCFFRLSVSFCTINGLQPGTLCEQPEHNGNGRVHRRGKNNHYFIYYAFYFHFPFHIFSVMQTPWSVQLLMSNFRGVNITWMGKISVIAEKTDVKKSKQKKKEIML